MFYFKVGGILFTSSPAASSSGRSGEGAGKGKESLHLSLWNLNICIEEVDAKC